MSYSVGDLAGLVGVTVRMLHHYDEIGLLRPSGRSSSGYRRYEEADVARLRQILTYRALGFSLREIASILDDPRANAGTHLRRQHHLLTDRIQRLQQTLAAVERALEDCYMGQQPAPRIVPPSEQQVELLGDVVFPDDWAARVAEAAGDTDEFRESSRRTVEYTAEDWQQIMADESAICVQLADLMAKGEPANSQAAMDLAEEHRSFLRRWFFECTPDAHVAVADMFDEDDRIRSTFEGLAAGLTKYLREAIHANAAQAESATG